MNIKHKNHTVTRGYLANWKATDSKGKSGIWYYDVNSRKVEYSEGLKAGFAVKNDIYVPVYIDGVRDDRLENWFSDVESQLCDFTRDFGRGTHKRWKPNALKKALMGIVSSSIRGDFSVTSMEDDYRRRFPDTPDDRLRLHVLNNLYSTAHYKADQFLRGTFIIVEAEKPTFMTNDQPFLDMSPRSLEPFAVFPLSPTRVLALHPSQLPPAGDMQFPLVKASDAPAIVDFARKASMRTARRWVVCSSEQDAREVGLYLTDDVLDEVRATDRMLYAEDKDPRWLFTVDNPKL